jgi:hypothetical protein
MSSLSYLGFKPSPSRMVSTGSSASICMAFTSSTALKASDEGGMVGPGDTEGTRRLKSLNSAVATAVTFSSMVSYLQFSAC